MVAESCFVQHGACCIVSRFCFGLCCKNGQKKEFSSVDHFSECRQLKIRICGFVAYHCFSV